MAPNECVTLLQQRSADSSATIGMVQVKIITTSGDDSDHEFFDAASEIHSDDNDSSSANKDSGVEADKEPQDFVVPDREMIEKINEQVEFYFSDQHLLKDAFLLKHVRRNKEGYISLKLISSFKKVKQVTRDWRVVAYACRTSAQLQVNEQGTKVRRVAPVPEQDETTPSRTVVVMGIPADKATMESVAEKFATYGSIVLIRILRPGVAVPSDVRQFASRHPEVSMSYCAVVEYEQAESARAAVVGDASADDWRKAIRVVELSPTRQKKGPVDPNGEQTKNRKQRNASKSKKTPSPASGCDTPTWSSSDAEDKSPFVRRKDLMRSPLSVSQGSTPYGSPNPQRHLNFRNAGSSLASSPEIRHRQKSLSCTETSPQPPRSPWVQRRMAASSASSDSGRLSPNNRLALPSNVLRMPYGPDGSRGFQLRSKPRSASAPEVALLTVQYAV